MSRLKSWKPSVDHSQSPLLVSCQLFHSSLHRNISLTFTSFTEIDEIFSTHLRHKSEAILAEVGVPYQINLFSGVAHGFTVRADLSVPNAKFAKEQAFVQAVAWFEHHL
jgi:dienelactone hydrolase